MLKRLVFFTYLLLFSALFGFGQEGSLFTTDFYFEKYTKETNCASICSDEIGNVYFAVPLGVLVFDGKSWSTVKIPDTPQVLYYYEGRVYVGCAKGFGYLKFVTHEIGYHGLTTYSEEDPMIEIKESKGMSLF